jgi:hypothetical protein
MEDEIRKAREEKEKEANEKVRAGARAKLRRKV